MCQANRAGRTRPFAWLLQNLAILYIALSRTIWTVQLPIVDSNRRDVLVSLSRPRHIRYRRGKDWAHLLVGWRIPPDSIALACTM